MKMLPRSWRKEFEIKNDAEISQFAWRIKDLNPLHHDYEAAVNAGLHGPIAPGVMIGGFISSTIAEKIPGVMVCGLDIRFPKPLYAGSIASVICSVLLQTASRAKIAFEVRSRADVVAKGSCMLLLPQV